MKRDNVKPHKVVSKPARILGKTVSLDQVKESGTSSLHKIASAKPEPKPLGKLIYKNIDLIKQIAGRVVATSSYNIPENLHIFPSDFITHRIISKPSTARWNQSLNGKATFPNPDGQLDQLELEWSMPTEGEGNYDHLALVLANIMMPRKSVDDVIECIKYQSGSDIIYPGLPIRLHGILAKSSDISRMSFRLTSDESRKQVRVDFNSSHKLTWSRNLFNRPVFVLGIVTKINRGVSVTAGALLF